ncbi:MAG: ribbon-helix-helix domain-containing protein [Actinomycetota bacterium]|nr:ribbon-helix-helix domain-containing protein [Actinomycetota bacterium]MDQ6949688.1 ribbon-helix-helix domain-containing protein [Actinomycetota bacterium]
MRTTIRLDPDLLAEAKRRAAGSGRTLTAFIEDAVREVLGREQESMRAEAFEVQPFDGTGVRTGVDLDDSAGLTDLMDSA